MSAALQPVISAEIMELHHKKHHQTYVNTFNTLAEQLSDAEAKSDVAKMIALQGGIKFNGGGVLVCTRISAPGSVLTFSRGHVSRS